MRGKGRKRELFRLAEKGLPAGWNDPLVYPGSGEAGAETIIVPSIRKGVVRWKRSFFHSGGES